MQRILQRQHKMARNTYHTVHNYFLTSSMENCEVQDWSTCISRVPASRSAETVPNSILKDRFTGASGVFCDASRIRVPSYSPVYIRITPVLLIFLAAILLSSTERFHSSVRTSPTT